MEALLEILPGNNYYFKIKFLKKGFIKFWTNEFVQFIKYYINKKMKYLEWVNQDFKINIQMQTTLTIIIIIIISATIWIKRVQI